MTIGEFLTEIEDVNAGWLLLLVALGVLEPRIGWIMAGFIVLGALAG